MSKVQQRQLARAKNSLLTFFERKLSVPRIYLDAEWDGHHVDVLAIDRDGVGDVHIARTYARPYESNGLLAVGAEGPRIGEIAAEMRSISAQYKYVVAVDVALGRRGPKFEPPAGLLDILYADDGLGRVGILQVDCYSEDIPEIHVSLQPERFRARVSELADLYVQKHQADWEIRDAP